MKFYKTRKMDLNEYQKEALVTAIYPEKMRINYPTLGLCGESGEVADKVKKVYRDHEGIFSPDIKKEILKEIGDVLWYVAVLSHDLGFTLEDVANANIEKLRSRKARGVIEGNGDNR